MKFKIHGTDKNGNEDYIIISGDSIDDIRSQSIIETKIRGWINLWSEQIE